MLAHALARPLARRGVHYGWMMVALTFVVALCSSAAVTLPGVLLLPLSQEFGWARGDISGAMGLMLALFAATAPFAGALILRHGLRRSVATAAALAVLALSATTMVAARWQLWLSFGLLGVAAGMVALALSATVANR